MLFSRTTFIGIDPTAGEKPFAYAALDHDLKLLALGHGMLDDVLAFAAGQRQAFVSVCAPRRTNQGCMSQEGVRSQLNPPPHPGRWENYRLADYLLHLHHLVIPRTPGNERDAPRWMRVGFELFRRLEAFGYAAYPAGEAERQSLEVYPFAAYAVLVGTRPFQKYSLEGRLQRQLVLYENQLDVPDPMTIFEEITRYRLLRGMLPLDNLYSAGELDALIGAYTAWLAALHPEQTTLLGDPDEGQVILPGKDLKPRY